MKNRATLLTDRPTLSDLTAGLARPTGSTDCSDRLL
jgi:hypothetical protein